MATSPTLGDDPRTLNALGMQALARDDPAEAEGLFARAAAADPGAAPLWMNLATARRARGDDAGERAALEGALATDQRHVMANVRMAELHDRLGEGRAAAFRWGGVATVLEATPGRTPALDGLLAQARARRRADGAVRRGGRRRARPGARCARRE